MLRMTSPATSARRPPARRYTLLDRLIGPLDQALRTLFGGNSPPGPTRPKTSPKRVESADDRPRKHAAALMRVNHSGEVAAQALYQGQASVAGSPMQPGLH